MWPDWLEHCLFAIIDWELLSFCVWYLSHFNSINWFVPRNMIVCTPLPCTPCNMYNVHTYTYYVCLFVDLLHVCTLCTVGTCLCLSGPCFIQNLQRYAMCKAFQRRCGMWPLEKVFHFIIFLLMPFVCKSLITSRCQGSFVIGVLLHFVSFKCRTLDYTMRCRQSGGSLRPHIP